jgi:hypothetical protein
VLVGWSGVRLELQPPPHLLGRAPAPLVGWQAVAAGGQARACAGRSR